MTSAGSASQGRAVRVDDAATGARPIIERVYWGAVASLNNEPHQLIEEALANLNEAVVACPEMLARLADEFTDGQHDTGSKEAAAA